MSTFYHRSDSHTINGLNGYKLLETQSSSGTYFQGVSGLVPVCGTITFKTDVHVRHSGGSQTLLGSGVAAVSRNSNGSGMQSTTWSCPLTALLTTDAIRVTEHIYSGAALYASRSFVTQQLGATTLEASTWTFYKYTWYNCSLIMPGPPPMFQYGGRFYHGNSTYNSRITNVSLTFPSGTNYAFIM